MTLKNNKDNFVSRMNKAADDMLKENKNLIVNSVTVGLIGIAAVAAPPVALAGVALWMLRRKH